MSLAGLSVLGGSEIPRGSLDSVLMKLFVRVCVCETGGSGGEGKGRGRERERMCACEKEGECVCECVCVCERERKIRPCPPRSVMFTTLCIWASLRPPWG